ncbi:MAG: hypothetical protein WA705_12045 [Candidatus Ozemobacteraceae bacterium]
MKRWPEAPRERITRCEAMSVAPRERITPNVKLSGGRGPMTMPQEVKTHQKGS